MAIDPQAHHVTQVIPKDFVSMSEITPAIPNQGGSPPPLTPRVAHASSARSSRLLANDQESPASPSTRAIAGIIAAGSLVILIIAAGLDPLPTQIGTHTQLGFPSCRWVTNLGLPCPTCGMTTAYANVVHGNLREGFLSQPFGFILAIGTGMAFWISTLVLVTGSHVYRCVTALWKPSFIWSIAILAFLSWAFKMWRMTSSGEFG